MRQIVDLEVDAEFQALGVELVSIAFDDAATQKQAAEAVGVVDTPMLVDADHSVSEAYDVLQWAVATGEPGHTFVLVDGDGGIAWLRDYGAQQNGGSMYVEPQELVDQIDVALNE
jgi:alkyl hydroperoxide reductase subunit AhpC